MPSIEKEFAFSSEKVAKSAAKAVSVELGKAYEKRSKTTIKTNKNLVLLKIIASNESALKASDYTYSRLIGLCKELSDGGN